MNSFMMYLVSLQRRLVEESCLMTKRLFKSPNSALNKARTQFLAKQRMLAKCVVSNCDAEYERWALRSYSNGGRMMALQLIFEE
ncbi:T22C5.22 [Arabidopsis thaliana]|uniref:T22C5.22 n=1 Tax=Arabidopsis thaliana TaxID=3702 RepID=Q9SFY2_ARATH|nr:T22C5.22 [Arabidopsis thaliana]